MHKKHLLISAFTIALLAIFSTTNLTSKTVNPPANSAGDPVTGNTCVQSGCHNGPISTSTSTILSNFKIGTGNPSTDLNSSFAYTPLTAYNIAMSLNSATGRYGFQIVALDNSNNQAGTFTVTSATSTKIVVSSGRQYMGHLNANSTKNWVFKWTAPASTVGPVTFYYCYNTSNGDGSPGSDVIYKGAVTINSSGTTGVADISDKVSALNIFPNPVSNQFGISFDLVESNNVSAQLFTLDGKLCKELISQDLNAGNFNQSFNISDLTAGIYLVKLKVGESSVTKKIFKQ